MRWRTRAVTDWAGTHLIVERKCWHESFVGLPWYGWVRENVWLDGDYLKLDADDATIAEAIRRFIVKELAAEAILDAGRNYSPRHYLSSNVRIERDSMDYLP